MTKTKKKPNEYMMCIVVLTALCLVISAALALTNMVTEPVITEGALKRAEAARIEVLPEADGFELVEEDSEEEELSDEKMQAILDSVSDVK